MKFAFSAINCEAVDEAGSPPPVCRQILAYSTVGRGSQGSSLGGFSSYLLRKNCASRV
jgi:hypothetical protein